MYVPLLTKTSYVNICLFIHVSYQYKRLTLMSYLSSCCISLRTRYVCVYCTLALYLKTFHWVISFGHPTIQLWFGFHVTLFEGLCPSSRIPPLSGVLLTLCVYSTCLS